MTPRSIRFTPRGLASALGATALAFALTLAGPAFLAPPALAQQTVPTLGDTADDAPPRGDPGQALARFLADAHPIWGRAEWRGAAWDGAPVAAHLPDGHALADAAPSLDGADRVRLAPDVSADGVSLALPWRGVRIESARAVLVGDHLVLEGFILANERGTLGAGALVLSTESLKVLGAALAGSTGDDALEAVGDVVVDGLAIDVRRPGPKGSGREFASRFSVERLSLVGVTLLPGDVEGAPALLDVAALAASGVSGAARFAGSAEFSLAELSFIGSSRGLIQAAQAMIGLAERPDGVDGGAFSFAGLTFSASRPGASPAALAIGRGSVRANFGEAASRVSLALTGARASAALFTGSPVEPAVQAIVARAGPLRTPGLAGAPHLAFDIEADASLRRERARFRLSCFAIPGVADAVAEIDVTLPEGAALGDLSPTTLLGARSQGVRIAVVDHGLGQMVREATGFSVSELLGAAAVAALEQRLPGPIARMTAPPLRNAIEIFDEQGSLSVAAPSPGPLALALGALLASAGPVEAGALESCTD